MNESIRNQATSCGEFKLFFALNIGKYHLKKNYEEKSGSSEEDEVSGFFVLSHLWMRGYFWLG